MDDIGWAKELDDYEVRAKLIERDAKIERVAQAAGYALAVAVVHGITGVMLAVAFKKMREVL